MIIGLIFMVLTLVCMFLFKRTTETWMQLVRYGLIPSVMFFLGVMVSFVMTAKQDGYIVDGETYDLVDIRSCGDTYLMTYLGDDCDTNYVKGYCEFVHVDHQPTVTICTHMYEEKWYTMGHKIYHYHYLVGDPAVNDTIGGNSMSIIEYKTEIP